MEEEDEDATTETETAQTVLAAHGQPDELVQQRRHHPLLLLPSLNTTPGAVATLTPSPSDINQPQCDRGVKKIFRGG